VDANDLDWNFAPTLGVLVPKNYGRIKRTMRRAHEVCAVPRRRTDMRKQVLAAVVVAVFALGLAGSLAWAADSVVSLDIPFSFIVQDREMPAGHYDIWQYGRDGAKVGIKSTNGWQTFLPVIERLADTGAKQPKVIFDKMENGKSYLSEIHIPGQDGFLVGIAKGKETHVMVTGKE
jgi:hypothetical protein